MEASGPNAEQIEYWNKQAGPKWAADLEQMDRLLSPLGLAAMDRLAPRAGERALDVGCGNGQTTLQLAERVTPSGAVLGIDISTPMLERARERARTAGVSHVRFENADAQTHSFAPQSFDLLFSRFGVMFFVDPGAAFANLARALRPGGRLAFVCWQSFMENAWMREPMMALAKHVTLQPPPPPEAPGPFAFSDAKRVTRILEGAGFKGVAFAPHTGQLSLGSSVESAARFSLEMGPLGAALRDAPESTKTAALDALRETFAKIATPNGVSLPFAAWIATGTR